MIVSRVLHVSLTCDSFLGVAVGEVDSLLYFVVPNHGILITVQLNKKHTSHSTSLSTDSCTRHTHLRFLALERLQQSVVVTLLLRINFMKLRLRKFESFKGRVRIATCKRLVDSSNRLNTCNKRDVSKHTVSGRSFDRCLRKLFIRSPSSSTFWLTASMHCWISK